MSLIQFQDLPSTSTPINAANLNNNFNELNGKLAATIALTSSATITVSTAYGYSRIPLNNIKEQKNSSGIVSVSQNGSITINKTGWYLVSGVASCRSTNTNNTIITTIYATSEQLGEAYRVATGKTEAINISPHIVYLTSGQQIWFSVSGSATGDITVSGSSNGRFTYVNIVEL